METASCRQHGSLRGGPGDTTRSAFDLSELCTASGVPERTLRLCCAEVLGVSPIRYFLLRRLNMTRSALRRADPETASVAEIARDHQFTELGRFAVVYRAIFGETPSSTCARSNPNVIIEKRSADSA